MGSRISSSLRHLSVFRRGGNFEGAHQRRSGDRLQDGNVLEAVDDASATRRCARSPARARRGAADAPEPLRRRLSGAASRPRHVTPSPRKNDTN